MSQERAREDHQQDVAHYVADGNPPPAGVGLCGADGTTVWKLALVTCRKCEALFNESLFRFRAEATRRWRRR